MGKIRVVRSAFNGLLNHQFAEIFLIVVLENNRRRSAVHDFPGSVCSTVVLQTVVIGCEQSIRIGFCDIVVAQRQVFNRDSFTVFNCQLSLCSGKFNKLVAIVHLYILAVFVFLLHSDLEGLHGIRAVGRYAAPFLVNGQLAKLLGIGVVQQCSRRTVFDCGSICRHPGQKSIICIGLLLRSNRVAFCFVAGFGEGYQRTHRQFRTGPGDAVFICFISPAFRQFFAVGNQFSCSSTVLCNDLETVRQIIDPGPGLGNLYLCQILLVLVFKCDALFGFILIFCRCIILGQFHRTGMRGRIVSNFCLAVNLHGCQRIARNQAFRVLFRYGVLAKRQIVDGIGINAFSILGKVRDIHRLLIARSIGAFLVPDRKLQAVEDLLVYTIHTVIGLGDRQLADFLVIGVGYSDNSLIILGNGNVNLSVFGYSQVIAGNLCVFRVFHDNVRTYRQVLPFLGFTRFECNPLFIVSSCNRTVLLIVGNGRFLCTFPSNLGGYSNLEGLRRIHIGNIVGDLGYRQFANFFGVGIFNSACSRICRRVLLGCCNSPAVCNCQIQAVLLCVCFVFLHRIVAHRQVFPCCNSSSRASRGNIPCTDRYPLGVCIIVFITLTGQRLSVRSIVDTVGIFQGQFEGPRVKIVANNLHCLGNLHIAAFLGVIVGYGDQFDVRLLSFSRFNIYGHFNTVCRNISVLDFNSETVFVPGITVNRRTVLIFFHIVGAGRQVNPCNLVRFSGLDFNPFVIPGYYRAVSGVVGRVTLIFLAVDSHTEDLVCKSRICSLVFVHSNSFRNIQPAQVFRVLVGEEYLGKVCAGQGSGSGNTAGGNFRNLRGFAVPAYPVGYLRQGIAVDYRAVFLFSHGIGSQGQMLQHKHSVAEILIGEAGFRGLQFCPFAMQVFGIHGIIPHRIVCSSINLCCNGESQFFFLLVRQFHRYTVKGECLVDLEHVADQGVCNGDLPDLVRLIPGQVAVAYCIPVHFRFCYGIGDLFAIDVFRQVIPFNRQCRAGRFRRDSLLFGLCSGAIRLDFGNGYRSAALIFSAQRKGYRRMIQRQSIFAGPGLRCLDLRGVKRIIVFNCQGRSKFSS